MSKVNLALEILLRHLLHILKYFFPIPNTKMPRFDVNIADPKRYFYPGETFAGNITVRVDERMRTKSIVLYTTLADSQIAFKVINY